MKLTIILKCYNQQYKNQIKIITYINLFTNVSKNSLTRDQDIKKHLKNNNNFGN